MFCPNCAYKSADDQKFCKACGTNLASVSQAIQGPRGVMPEQEWNRPRQGGQDDPEWKRSLIEDFARSEKTRRSSRLMPAGLMVCCAGIGVMLFFYILFSAIASGETNPQDVAVLHSLWAIGLVPFFIGVGLFLSGFLFGRRSRIVSGQQQQPMPAPNAMAKQGLLTPQREETFTPSITEHTTRHLSEQPVGSIRSARNTKEVN